MKAKNVTVSLPEPLWRKTRNFADREGKSLSGLIKELLENFFDEKRKLQSAHEEIRKIAQEYQGDMKSWKREELYEI